MNENRWRPPPRPTVFYPGRYWVSILIAVAVLVVTVGKVLLRAR